SAPLVPWHRMESTPSSTSASLTCRTSTLTTTQPFHPAVAELRAAVRETDAVLFSTPEYAGALPGSFKNLLDWMIGDDKAGSIYEKPVAWINPSAHGAVNAVGSLRTVLGYAHASTIDAACVDIPITQAAIGDDGLIADASIRATISGVLTTLAVRR